MAKDLTAKDVLYALEYLGETLERVSIRSGRHVWQLGKSKQPVKEAVANEVRQSSAVRCDVHLSTQTVSWRRSA